jgi:HlyD family secretion protein
MFERNRAQFAAAFVSAQAFDDAKASYDAARANLDVATRALGVAEASLAVAQRNLDDTVVRAPFGGIVTVKAAQEGEMVSPVSAGGGFTRTGIGTIVDMDSLEVEVDVSESFISRVETGQPVSITLNAYPDRRMPGRVIAIIPTADRAKATVKVRVGFEQPDGGVLPEMGARVAFLSKE